MGLPSLVPVPVFLRGSTSLRLRPKPPAGAGSVFRLKVKDGPIGHAQQFVVGDILRVKVWNNTSILDNWLEVGSVSNPGSSEGYFAYDCVRKSGTAGLIPAGTAVVNYGQSGQGFISLSTDGTIGSSPNITIGKHSGQPWASTTILSRYGNLNGSYGQASNVYGAGIGDYSAGNYLLYDGSTFSVKGGGGNVTIDGNGLSVSISAAASSERAYRFYTASPTLWYGMLAYETGGTSYLRIDTVLDTGNGNESFININSTALTGNKAYTRLQATSGGQNVFLQLLAESDGNSYGYVDSKFLVGGSTVPNASLDVSQLTLGSEVLRLFSNAFNDDPTESLYQNRVATTDATATVIHTVALTSDYTYMIEARIVGRRTGGSAGAAGDSAAYLLRGAYKNIAGTVTNINAAFTTVYSEESQAGWSTDFNISGSDVQVRVTGAVNNNVSWHAHVRTWLISS